MLDTIRNQKLFVISLIGIVVVSLMLTTTYAYQSIRVNYAASSNNNLTVEAGKLNVSYTSSDRINIDNIPLLKNYKLADYTEFTVDNAESTGKVAYLITLSELTYSSSLASSDFKYTLTLVNDDNTEEEVSFGNFSLLSSNQFDINFGGSTYRYLDAGEKDKLRLYLWIKETTGDQNDLENASFQGKITITSLFAHEVESTRLADVLINKANISTGINATTFNKNFDLNTITGVSTESDHFMAETEDDYGYSYVYRGNVIDNYVDFAGFIWRVVRINGDGSVRLILDGTLDLVKKEGESDYVYKNSALYALDTDGLIQFKTSPYNDNGHVGYMYGDFESNSTTYDEAHANINSSTIKTYIDTFYTQYLSTYQSDYIADTMFCADKTRAEGYTNLGFGTGTSNKTCYGAYDRLYKSSTKSTPTLKCVDRSKITDTALTDEQLSYSRYTSNIDASTHTNKGVLVNNDLTYPIGLMSADELVMAGAYKDKHNSSYYLYDAHGYATKVLSYNWWTMSPFFLSSDVYEFYSYVTGSSLDYYYISSSRGVRPVINLKANVLVDSGNGTKDYTYDDEGNVLTGPYTVKLT